MNTCLRTIAFGVLAASLGLPEDAAGGRMVRGEIVGAGQGMGSLTVELGGGIGIPERATVNGDGSFMFRSAPSGTYQLRVLSPQGAILHQQLVTIGGGPDVITVRLDDSPTLPPNASRSAGSSISLRQLQHKVPGPAQKAYDKAEHAAAKAQYFQAAESYRQAVAIDPEFVDAYNQLGTVEVQLGNLQKAADQFQKAVDLEPDHPQALPNLSIVLAKMRRYKEAGSVARRALKVTPGSGPIHYILAVSLLVQNGDHEEILDNLERSTADVPKAHLLAANLLIEWGKPEDAARHLQDYLRILPAGDADRARVESDLARLQAGAQTSKE